MIVPEVNYYAWGRDDIDHKRPQGFFSGGPGSDGDAPVRTSKEPIGFRKRVPVDESWRLWSDYV